MTDSVLWKLENVSKVYTMGDIQVTALHESSLEVFGGEFLVVLGPSGSGKSTLLNLIGGMDTPTTGSILFEEEDLAKATQRRLTAYRRHEVGFVFQFYNLIPDLTALENVAVAAELSEKSLKPEEVLDQVGMADRLDHFPSQMSGGEQQRVAIARAVVKNPRLLLCDEPTGSLDSETGRRILALLADVSKTCGSTVVVVTHNAAIADMAGRVARMSSGRIVETAVNEAPLPPERISW